MSKVSCNATNYQDIAQLENTIASYQEMLKVLPQPQKGVVHYSVANNYLEMSKLTGNKLFLEESLKHYNEAIKIDPSNVFFVANRAVLLNTMDKKQAAIKDIKFVQELTKDGTDFSTESISATFIVEELLEKLSSKVDLDKKLSGEVVPKYWTE